MRIEVVRAEPGETMWCKGSSCDFAMFICTGGFELESPDDQLGRFKLSQGQMVGDFPNLINDKVKTISSVKCIKAGDMLKIKRNLLLDFLFNNPGLFILLRDKLVVD